MFDALTIASPLLLDYPHSNNCKSFILNDQHSSSTWLHDVFVTLDYTDVESTRTHWPWLLNSY